MFKLVSLATPTNHVLVDCDENDWACEKLIGKSSPLGCD